MKFDIKKIIPLLTTKRVPWKSCIEELLWFLQGKTDAIVLNDKACKIWNGNSSRQFLDKIGLHKLEEGDCGANYSFQWRHFGAEYEDCKTDYENQGIDQIAYVENLLKNDKYSRRIFFTAWKS
jgi:thymidylate synthase